MKKLDPCLAATRSGAIFALVMATLALAQERKSEPPKHLAIALELLKEVEPGNTSYRHKNNVVKRKTGEKAAECHADCSGFVNWLLLEAAGEQPTALVKWFRAKRPVARHYHNAIVAGEHFQRIARIQDCKPGDVVAMKYPKGNENTGHVMVLVEKPVKRDAVAPLVDGSEQWLAKILDSTTSPHGSDSRRDKEGNSRGGLGTGVFRFYANKDGELVGCTWGPGPRSEFRPAKERPIVVGRFRP
jgi:hypothetical protein